MDDPNESRPLWAPWRIEYIRRMKVGDETGCFMCRDGESPDEDTANYVIARGRTCFVLLNRYPYNPGHLLVTPYRHVGDLDALTPAERTEMFELLIQGQTALKGAMQPHGFNMGCNLGQVAGAAVADHVHFHLVPRWAGDTNFMPILGKIDCIPQALAEAATALRQHWPGRE